MAGNALFKWPLKVFPDITTAGRFPLKDTGFHQLYKGNTHAIHLHDYEGMVNMDGAEIPLRPGIITLSEAGGETRYHLPKPGHHWCVHFLPAAEPRSESFELPCVIDTGAMASHVAERFRQIARRSLKGRLAGEGAREGRAAASVALQDMLLWLWRWVDSSGLRKAGRGLGWEAAAEAMAAIDERLAETATIAELLRPSGISHNNVTRIFRERYGMSPARYRLLRRMEHAQLLLRTTRLSVKEVAATVGIPDAQHFNKQFRRLAGSSPSAARLEEQL